MSCKNKTALVNFPDRLPLQNVLHLHQHRILILGVHSLALWKIITEEDAFMIPQNRGEKFSSGFLHSDILRRGEPLCRHSIDCCFVSGHSDITRFLAWSPIATRNHLEGAEKILKIAQTTGIVDVFDPRSGISGPTSRRASACPILHERWTQPAHLRCPLAHLLI